DVLVVGSVKNDHFAFARSALVGAPEKIVIGLLFARLLESEDRRPLRVHSAEHVPDDAVLAGGVKSLQDDEKGLIAVRVEQVLQFGHAFDMGLDLRQSLLMGLVLAGVGGIDFR